ncbi:MAG: EAL domain-containing protein [Candidatus Thiodiazotropha sp. (ex Myrtea sp. 'scaly one' KF741663)]|nr:EAL domain-containing protein [Candidatus Thiodiazotropha sp. (ex Myrtea sp. 'scaly one' KF741663)]
MPNLTEHPIQRHIIGLALSIIAIVAVLVVIHTTLREKSSQIELQLNNQLARQDIGISIYQRLFAAKATVFKLSTLDNQLELDIVKRRFDANLHTIKNGLSVLQNGGVFKDAIATNIPGQNIMDLVATYKKPDSEGYILEVLELGPAIHNLEKQSQLLCQLIQLQISTPESLQSHVQSQINNLMKTINAIQQRTQENAARILYDSQERISSLSTQLKQAEQLHDKFRLPVVILALSLAGYLLIITLTKVGRVIANRKQAEDQLQLLLDTTAEGIYGIDIQGNTTFVNPAASRMLGFRQDELINRENHELIHHTHSDGSRYPAAECHIMKVLQGGTLKTVQDEVFWRKDGSSFPVEYSSSPIYRDKKVVGAVVSFRDISARKHDEKRIRTLLQAVEQSPVSVVMTDTKGDIEYVNHAFEEATGYKATEVIGQNPRILKSEYTPPAYFQDLWEAIISGHSWQGELQNRRKNGTLFWERAYIAPVLDESGTTTHYLAVKEDITLQKQQEEKIIHQANYDSLTDLPNRFLTLDRLSQLIKEAQRKNDLAAVLFLDLDDFKKINDSMSHEVGDKLLIQAAKRLQESVRTEDTVSRLGGDEFIVLLGSLSTTEDVYPIAEKLLSSFRETFLLDGRELILTASIGIAIYPNDGDDPAELLRNADTAMYQSKEQGRNTYNYFTEAMNKGVSRRLQLEEQLHGALERGEFELHYQPIVDTLSRNIVAVEALLRWNSSVLGEVKPDEFIPITEQTGQIVPIGQYVIQEAFSKVGEWQSILNKDFKIAINISPRQFRDPNLLQMIGDTSHKLSIPTASIKLEVTEGVLMSGHTYIGDTIKSLNKLGVGIAMDDFGTGYSSLSYLRSYPFDTLKIDRSFVNDITIDPADRELVNATIAMAHGLGLKVIAEGVETEEQLLHLAEHDCEMAQGYLFSKPVSAKKITRMLERQNQSKTDNPSGDLAH